MSRKQEKSQKYRKTIKNLKTSGKKKPKYRKPSKISIKREKTVKNVEKPVKGRKK